MAYRACNFKSRTGMYRGWVFFATMGSNFGNPVYKGITSTGAGAMWARTPRLRGAEEGIDVLVVGNKRAKLHRQTPLRAARLRRTPLDTREEKGCEKPSLEIQNSSGRMEQGRAGVFVGTSMRTTVVLLEGQSADSGPTNSRSKPGYDGPHGRISPGGLDGGATLC